jgi:hypothetical protein
MCNMFYICHVLRDTNEKDIFLRQYSMIDTKSGFAHLLASSNITVLQDVMLIYPCAVSSDAIILCARVDSLPGIHTSYYTHQYT